MKKILFIITLFLLFSDISYSIDTISTKYFPLKVGNSWTYNFFQYYGGFYKYKSNVIGTFIEYGHLYYKIIHSPLKGNNDTSSYRIDSTSGKLLMRTDDCQESPIELLIDSLSSNLNDSCNVYCFSFGGPLNVCEYISNENVLGQIRFVKTFVNLGFEQAVVRYYAKDIGLYKITSGGPWNNSSTDLLGCVINGVVFGDTTLIGITPISTELPSSYKLYQNYPNPFNPSTKIKFSIPAGKSPLEGGTRGDIAKLIVFDILGREITTLVNEKLSPGTYEVEWHAPSANASSYPSGVYFYTLYTSSFIQTKKMLLIK